MTSFDAMTMSSQKKTALIPSWMFNISASQSASWREADLKLMCISASNSASWCEADLKLNLDYAFQLQNQLAEVKLMLQLKCESASQSAWLNWNWMRFSFSFSLLLWSWTEVDTAWCSAWLKLITFEWSHFGNESDLINRFFNLVRYELRSNSRVAKRPKLAEIARGVSRPQKCVPLPNA